MEPIGIGIDAIVMTTRKLPYAILAWHLRLSTDHGPFYLLKVPRIVMQVSGPSNINSLDSQVETPNTLVRYLIRIVVTSDSWCLSPFW